MAADENRAISLERTAVAGSIGQPRQKGWTRMIKLSRMADYGIVVMTQLVRAEGKQMSATDLAEQTRIPLPTVSKVMKTLSRNGLVQSSRGAHGGYDLARGKERISVVEVIEAMDGPIALTTCVDDADDSCPIGSICQVRPNWQRINDAIKDALSTITLDEMSQTIPPAFMVAADDKIAENGAV
jgi:FeS assembly SUF system regulator